MACLGGNDGICFNGKISGYYTPGTFQQYTLGPAHYVTPIPDKVDSATAAPMLCGGVTTYAALRKSGAGPGDWVAVMGAGGGLGHIATQIAAKGMGMRVIGVDHSSKKDLVLSLGAEHFVGIDTESDVPATVTKLSDGLGVKAVLVLTRKFDLAARGQVRSRLTGGGCIASMKAYEQSLYMLRFSGRLMVVGIPDHDTSPIASATPNQLVSPYLSDMPNHQRG